MFDKSVESFPIKKHTIFLNSCGVGPLYGPACEKAKEILECQRDAGLTVWKKYWGELDRVHRSGATLLGTEEENLSCIPNTATGLSMLANGYPFTPGDEIISYVHEYPSNHYPWRLQEARGAVLKLLPDRAMGSGIADGKPRGWDMEDLKRVVTSRTRVFAISHVQFTSGFAANLQAVGQFCEERGIDLIVDAAQSLGVLPIDVRRDKIAALASSGWKWLGGPGGSGLMFTSPEFRKKIAITMAGPELMQQGDDYLNHAWQPYSGGRQYEYSTEAIALVGGLATSVETIGVRYGIQTVALEARKLRQQLREGLSRSSFRLVDFGSEHESGILSYETSAPALEVAKKLAEKGVTCSSRGGYLRFAPHYFNTEEEIERAVEIINESGF